MYASHAIFTVSHYATMHIYFYSSLFYAHKRFHMSGIIVFITPGYGQENAWKYANSEEYILNSPTICGVAPSFFDNIFFSPKLTKRQKTQKMDSLESRIGYWRDWHLFSRWSHLLHSHDAESDLSATSFNHFIIPLKTIVLKTMGQFAYHICMAYTLIFSFFLELILQFTSGIPFCFSKTTFRRPICIISQKNL